MDLFFKAVAIQARDRTTGVVPGLEDYIAVRRDTSACKPSWALIEYANGLDLPDEVMEHQTIQSLDEAANDFVTWSNVSIDTRPTHFPPVLTLDVFQDLFSYNREQANGDEHNIVVIMIRYHEMSLQEAVDFIGDLCKKSIDRFIEVRARLPSWGPEIDAQVQVYVQGLADCIACSLHWSFDSERYFAKKGGQIKKSGIVELAPVRVPEPAAPADSSVVTEAIVGVC